MMDRIVFWGVCLVIVLLPLPFGAVDEWAIFTFEAATFVLFVLHVLGRNPMGAPSIDLDSTGIGRGKQTLSTKTSPGEDSFRTEDSTSHGKVRSSSAIRFPGWLKVLPAIALGAAIIQIIPLPISIVAALSPRAGVIWRGLSAEGLAGAAGAGGAGGGWATLSLVPNFTLYELIRYIFYFLFAYLVYRHVSTRKRVKIFVFLLFAAACFQSFYGLAEFFGGTQRIFGFQREAYMDSATGTFINRNHFAGFLEMIFPISVGYLLARASFFAMKRGGSLKERILWFSQERLQKVVVFGIVPVLIGVGIFFSRSRTGIFLFFASIFLMVVALSGAGGRRPEGVEGTGGPREAGVSRPIFGKVIRTVLLLVVFAVILIGIKPVIERFSFAALAHEVRPVYFKNTVEIIKDFPIAGTGLGTYLYAYPMYEKKYSGDLLDHAHNDYLELLAEGGIVAGGLMIVVAFGALIWLFARWAKRNDHLVRGVGLGCLVGIASILIHSLTDFNLHITANAVLFVTLYALGMRVVGLSSSRDSR
jgi:O-antigen ligase